MSAPLTLQEVLALPVLITTPQAAAALGISVSHAYRATAAGDFPLEPIRIGRVIRYRRTDLLNLLGITDQNRSTT